MVMQPFKAHSHQMGFSRVSNPILDAVQQFWPWRKYAGDQLHHGVLPLWNPYMLSGTPFVANNQSAVFYPETWLFALLTPERAFAWSAALYLFASGSFMFWFLRTVGLRRRAALLGAVAWVYNGFVVGWICLPSFRSVPGWLPLVLTAYESARRAEGPARAPWLALGTLAFGLQFLAGNLHVSFYLLLTFALYVLASASWRARRGESPVPALVAAALMAVAGAALAALQLLPTLEFAARSHRRAIAYASTLGYRLPWPYLFAGLMPDLFGNPVDYNHWGCFLGPQYRAYTETAWYTGAFTPVLALLAFARPTSRSVYFWAALFLLAFALALGSPLNALFYHLVPGFRQLPGINRAILLACFALPILAAWGAQCLLDAPPSPDPRRSLVRALAYAVVAVLGLGFIGAVWAWMASAPYEAAGLTSASQPWGQFLRFALLLAVSAVLTRQWLSTRRKPWALALLVMFAADVGYFGAHFFPLVPERYCRPPSDIVSTLQAMHDHSQAAGLPFRVLSVAENAIGGRMPPNVPMIFDLEDIQGSDSITYGRYTRLLAALAPSSTSANPAASSVLIAPDHPLVKVLGVWAIVTADRLPPAAALDPALTEGDCTLYLLERPRYRAHVAAYLRAATTDDEMLALVTASDQDPNHWTPVLALADLQRLVPTARSYGDLPPVDPKHSQGPTPSGGWWVPGPYAAQSRPIYIQTLTPNAVRLHATPPSQPPGPGPHSAPGLTPLAFMPGDLLVIHDTYYPGWRAYADGRPVPLLVADYCFRAVPLPLSSVTQHVDLAYQPTSFTLGCFLSLAATAAILALLALGGTAAPRRHG